MSEEERAARGRGRGGRGGRARGRGTRVTATESQEHVEDVEQESVPGANAGTQLPAAVGAELSEPDESEDSGE